MPDFTPQYVLCIDFETHYDADYSLKKLGTEGYVRDPRFETIGVAVDDGEECTWFEDAEFRAWAKTIDWSKCAVIMHHAHFDGLILAHHYGIFPGFFFCTLSMARAIHGPGKIGLEYLMPKYGLGQKGHEVVEAKGKRRKDFTQAEWLQYGVYSMNDVRGTKGIFYAMTDGGEFPESELHLNDAIIRMFTEPVFQLDEPLLTQYLIDERKRKKEMLDRLSETPELLRSVLMSNDKFAELLWSLGIDPPKKISIAKTKAARLVDPKAEPVETYAFAKSDPGMQELLEHPEDQIRWLAEARVATKSTINETRTERFLRLGKSGQRMCVYLKASGAHTHRLSGADGTNWQNLERYNKKKPESGALRRAVVAPVGERVIVADSSQIEARKTAWLAGHEVLLKAFADKRDIYSELASVIYNRHVDRKKNPDDFLEGFIAKCAYLGLGYSMGYYTFAATLLRGMLGGPTVQFKWQDAENLDVDLDKFLGGKTGERRIKRIKKMPSRITEDEKQLHCAVADKIVRIYRKENEPIVELWKLMGEVIETMYELGEDEQVSFGPGDCLFAERHAILLPSGLKLNYPGLEYRERRKKEPEEMDDEDEEEYEGGYYSYLGAHNQRRKIYGGMLTENVVQALARIVITDQLLHIKAKYNRLPASFTHDELIYVAPEQHAAQMSRILEDTMKTPPSWAPGLPLASEGGFAQSYGLAK